MPALIRRNWVPAASETYIQSIATEVASSGDAAVEAIARPSLFTAIEEQLGLKLRPAKHMIDIWVVDHVERVAVEN